MRFSNTHSGSRHGLVAVIAMLASLGLAGVALADEVGVSSSSSKLSCHMVNETQCTADTHGNVSGCHTVQVKECTVVGGVGAAQMQGTQGGGLPHHNRFGQALVGQSVTTMSSQPGGFPHRGFGQASISQSLRRR